MGDDLVLISWNVEKKSLSAFKSGDTPDLIAQSIAETVEAMGSSGVDTPFVAYLLEIKGEEADVEKMCGRLKAAYKDATGQDIEVVANGVGGGEYTSESIITMSRDVTVKNRPLDLQPKIKEAVQADEAQANVAFQKKTEARASRKRKTTPDSLQPKPEHFRKNVKEPEWFRNGVFSEIKLGEAKLQASVVHSPGPSHVKDFSESVDAARDTAAENGSDLLLGDFNRDGEFAGGDFTDTLSTFDKGTTLNPTASKKSGKLELGPRKRDRVLELKHSFSRWRFTTHEPIVKGRGLGEARLTDHAMICVGATPKSKGEMRQYFRETLSGDFGTDSDEEMLEYIVRTGDIEGTSWFENEDGPDMPDDDEDFDPNLRTKRRKKVSDPNDFGVFGNNTNTHNATPDDDDDYDALEEESDLLYQLPSDAGGQSSLLTDPLTNPSSSSSSAFNTPSTTPQSNTVDMTDGEAADEAAVDITEAGAEELAELAVFL